MASTGKKMILVLPPHCISMNISNTVEPSFIGKHQPRAIQVNGALLTPAADAGDATRGSPCSLLVMDKPTFTVKAWLGASWGSGLPGDKATQRLSIMQITRYKWTYY